MLNKLKDFFGVTADTFIPEIYDLTTILTVLNVLLIITGYWWAPIIGLANCAIFIVYSIMYHSHLNAYLTQMALILLNIYFLTL